MTRFDFLITGGGIVGLATGRELLRRHPDLRIAILEKEHELATHQSGHNSGVIHQGMYYAPGSLRARACVEGSRLMSDFVRERGIAHDICGKVIVALNDSELPRLHTLFERGNQNGVRGLEMIERARLREIEPYCEGIAAIWSPNTGIVDYRAVALAYADDIRRAGGEILTGHRVIALHTRADSVIVQAQTESGETEIEAGGVIACGGLHSDRLGRMTGEAGRTQIVPFRGDYYTFKPDKAGMVRGLIYPVPDPRVPFLGVHFTRIVNGEVWAGPNAVWAFAREGYRRTDFNLRDVWEAISGPAFLRFALRYWQIGLDEFWRDTVKAAYVRQLQKYLPDIQSDDLIEGPSGVRAMAISPEGKIYDDFLMIHSERVTHVLNAPSPAATASLVLGRMIADEVIAHQGAIRSSTS